MGVSPLIIAYFTVGTEYAEEVNKLRSSLLQLDLEFDIEGLPNLGSWDANTHYKPTFIRRMMQKHNRSVIYLDADSVVNSYPHKFFDIPEEIDFGCCYFVWHQRRREMSGAVLYFSNSEKSLQILNDWEYACRTKPRIFDQFLIQQVIEQGTGQSAKVLEFPKEYDVIFDIHAFIKNPVITQNQASRRFKDTVAKLDTRQTHEALLKGKYKGCKAVILGKGDSLNELGEFDRREYVTMGINDVFKRFNDLDQVFYFDSITYHENKEGFDNLLRQGTWVWTTFPTVVKGHFKVRMESNPYGFEMGKFHHSFTSAYFCLQLLVWAGCKEIYLAGVDLTLPTKGDYYDGSHAREGDRFLAHLVKMRPGFEIAANNQELHGFRVYRTSELSSLDMFEVKKP